jgi:hypothetical protein
VTNIVTTVTNADGSVTIALPPRVDHVEIYVLPSMPVVIVLAVLVAAWVIVHYKNRNSN